MITPDQGLVKIMGDHMVSGEKPKAFIVKVIFISGKGWGEINKEKMQHHRIRDHFHNSYDFLLCMH